MPKTLATCMRDFYKYIVHDDVEELIYKQTKKTVVTGVLIREEAS